jgi:hypothetical protein
MLNTWHACESPLPPQGRNALVLTRDGDVVRVRLVDRARVAVVLLEPRRGDWRRRDALDRSGAADERRRERRGERPRPHVTISTQRRWRNA